MDASKRAVSGGKKINVTKKLKKDRKMRRDMIASVLKRDDILEKKKEPL